MKSRFMALIVFFLLPVAGLCEEIDEHYRQLVDEMLEVTGALEIGEQMSGFVVAELTRALKEVDHNLPDRAYEVLESEVRLLIREEMESGSFHELMYPIYRKYLDAEDLQAAIRFYRTEEGKKIVSVLPQLSREGMMAGQSWGASLGPKIAERVRARLAEEGIELP